MAVSRKGVSDYIAYSLLVAVVITAIGIVLDTSIPLFDKLEDTGAIATARNTMVSIDESIRLVASYGPNTSTTHTLRLRQGSYRLLPGQDAVSYTIETEALGYSPGVSRRYGNLFVNASNETGMRQVTIRINYSSIDLRGDRERLGRGIYSLRMTNQGTTGNRTRVGVSVE